MFGGRATSQHYFTLGQISALSQVGKTGSPKVTIDNGVLLSDQKIPSPVGLLYRVVVHIQLSVQHTVSSVLPQCLRFPCRGLAFLSIRYRQYGVNICAVFAVVMSAGRAM